MMKAVRWAPLGFGVVLIGITIHLRTSNPETTNPILSKPRDLRPLPRVAVSPPHEEIAIRAVEPEAASPVAQAPKIRHVRIRPAVSKKPQRITVHTAQGSYDFYDMETARAFAGAGDQLEISGTPVVSECFGAALSDYSTAIQISKAKTGAYLNRGTALLYLSRSLEVCGEDR